MIQLTKVAKAITKNYVAWIKKDNYNYILSEHFIIKTKQEIKGALLTKLLSKLGAVPTEGQGIQSRLGVIGYMADTSISAMLSHLERKDCSLLEFTKLVQQTDVRLLSIFKGEKGYIFISKDYVDIVNRGVQGIDVYGSNGIHPVFFDNGNEEMLVLPARAREVPIYLKDI